jgi:hypothetical protein
MSKGILLFVFGALVVIGCTRRFSCDCDYISLSYELNDDGDTVEIRTSEDYRSSIAYTSKKLANEECDERGRSIGLDTLNVEISCGISKE